MRGERGQTAAEFTGVMLVISMVLGAIATTDLDTKIANRAKELVCQIVGAECGAGDPATEPLPESDLEGPPLTGRPIVALPFPGSVSVTCTAAGGQLETCLPEGRPGVGVKASGEVRIERTPTTLDPNGCPWQTLSVQTRLQLTANAEAEGARAGGSLQAYLGQSTRYQLTVAPSAADEIADGRRDPPNPVDPRTLATGESIQLSEEYYAGINARGTYRQLQLEMGYSEGQRVSSGVRRMDEDTVRVMVGDEEFVRNALKFGVSLGDASVSLGNSKELADGRLHAVDIDISTQEGWDAYQAFLESGRLPRSGTPGTHDPTQATTISYTDTTSLEGTLGPISVGGQLGSSAGRVTETRNADGSVDVVTHVRYNDTSFAIVERQDADGDAVGDPTYSLMLHGIDESYIDYLYDGTGQQRPSGAPQSDVRLDFTEAQLEQLQELALERLADQVELNGDGRPSPEEIARSLRENHGVVEFEGVQYDFGGLESDLGMAETPAEMLAALYRQGFSSPNSVIEAVAGLLDGPGDLPATINNPSC